MPSSSDLVGSVKTPTDLLSRETRIHWNEASEVALQYGRRLIFTFPAHPGGFLDLSSIHFSAIIKHSPGANAATTIDSTSLSQLFHQVKLRHGNVVIGDVDFYSTLCPVLEKINTTSLVSAKERIIDGGLVVDNAERAALGSTFAGTGKRYNIYFLRNTIFNCSALLPVDRLSRAGPLQLELYLENPAVVVNSTVATDNLILSDLDLYCNYLFSPSLAAAKDWKVNFDTDGYEFKYVTIGNNQRCTLRLGSTLSDLQYALIGFRNDAGDVGIATNNTPNKLQNFVGYQAVSQFQLFVESRPWFAEQLSADKTALMLWKETRKSEPNIIYSRFFTDYERASASATFEQPPIIINLQAAPRFSREMKSGVSSTKHNVEMYADVTFSNLPNTIGGGALNAFCWLKHTVRVFEDQYGQLQVSR